VALSWNSKNRAFTLVELVISIAILSAGIMAVLQALSFSARMSGLSCDIINAVFLAEDKLQELEFKENQDLIGKQPTNVKDGSNKFDWAYTLVFEPKINLYKLQFNVSWQAAIRKEELELNTYLR